MNHKKLIVAVAGGASALALVGIGAGATFTTAAASSQQVSAGHLRVSVSALGASCTVADADGCHALTLPSVGPVGSTFDTAPTLVTVTNTGDVSAFFNTIQIGESHDTGNAASNALSSQMNVCIKTTDPASVNPGNPASTWVEGNGPLTKAVWLHPSVTENPVELHKGESFTYQMEFYAGKDSSCGATSSDGSNTRAAWGNYTTPLSLTDAAQGGSVTPTLTFGFTG